MHGRKREYITFRGFLISLYHKILIYRFGLVRATEWQPPFIMEKKPAQIEDLNFVCMYQGVVTFITFNFITLQLQIPPSNGFSKHSLSTI